MRVKKQRSGNWTVRDYVWMNVRGIDVWQHDKIHEENVEKKPEALALRICVII